MKNQYKINPSAQIVKNHTEYYIGVGRKQYSTNKSDFDKSIKLLNFLKVVRDITEIENFLKDNQIDNYIFDKLKEHKLITSNPNLFERKDTIDFKNELYLELLTKNTEATMSSFRNTTFLILGCGGIGNFISYALASFNPKKIILVDGDTIEVGNLNRQFLFSNSNIGELKANVLKEELLKRNPNLDIDVISSFITEDSIEILTSIINRNTFGVLSADSDRATDIVGKIFAGKASYLNIGYLNDISVIGPFYIPDVSSCLYCNNSLSLETLNNMYDEMVRSINAENSAPSSFVNNAVAVSLALSDIIQYFDGNFEQIKSLNSRVGIDNLTFDRYSIPVEKDELCMYCGR